MNARLRRHHRLVDRLREREIGVHDRNDRSGRLLERRFQREGRSRLHEHHAADRVRGHDERNDERAAFPRQKHGNDRLESGDLPEHAHVVQNEGRLVRHRKRKMNGSAWRHDRFIDDVGQMQQVVRYSDPYARFGRRRVRLRRGRDDPIRDDRAAGQRIGNGAEEHDRFRCARSKERDEGRGSRQRIPDVDVRRRPGSDVRDRHGIFDQAAERSEIGACRLRHAKRGVGKLALNEHLRFRALYARLVGRAGEDVRQNRSFRHVRQDERNVPHDRLARPQHRHSFVQSEQCVRQNDVRLRDVKQVRYRQRIRHNLSGSPERRGYSLRYAQSGSDDRNGRSRFHGARRGIGSRRAVDDPASDDGGRRNRIAEFAGPDFPDLQPLDLQIDAQHFVRQPNADQRNVAEVGDLDRILNRFSVRGGRPIDDFAYAESRLREHFDLFRGRHRRRLIGSRRYRIRIHGRRRLKRNVKRLRNDDALPREQARNRRIQRERRVGDANVRERHAARIRHRQRELDRRPRSRLLAIDRLRQRQPRLREHLDGNGCRKRRQLRGRQYGDVDDRRADRGVVRDDVGQIRGKGRPCGNGLDRRRDAQKFVYESCVLNRNVPVVRYRDPLCEARMISSNVADRFDTSPTSVGIVCFK